MMTRYRWFIGDCTWRWAHKNASVDEIASSQMFLKSLGRTLGPGILWTFLVTVAVGRFAETQIARF